MSISFLSELKFYHSWKYKGLNSLNFVSMNHLIDSFIGSTFKTLMQKIRKYKKSVDKKN